VLVGHMSEVTLKSMFGMIHPDWSEITLKGDGTATFVGEYNSHEGTYLASGYKQTFRRIAKLLSASKLETFDPNGAKVVDVPYTTLIAVIAGKPRSIDQWCSIAVSDKQKNSANWRISASLSRLRKTAHWRKVSSSVTFRYSYQNLP